MKFFSHVGLTLILASFASSLQAATAATAATPSAESQAYLDYVKALAAKWRDGDPTPANLAAWQKQEKIVRTRLEEAWGGFPSKPVALDARKLGELRRDGYRIEKIIFQTRPGVWMTANAYVPERAGRHPAVLAVHGHWKGAKQDPVLQALHVGLVKQGYFVLAVDAFGAGERGVNKPLGEYHGEMVAGTLFPVGLPLSGLQVYENMRAVDYLLTRPEVDPKKLAITGASGGGNQSMYAGAWDRRFAVSVPVCSVGNYQAYLGTGCCMCEVVPGALQFAEEWAVLGLTAPRALLVINATIDSVPFSVSEAKKSIARVQPIFDLYKKSDHLQHTPVVSKHDYGEPMRTVMYGWVARHLKGEGNGSPLPDPEIKTEDPELLRCFPGESRPDDFVTIPKFAAAEARKILLQIKPPLRLKPWQEESRRRQTALVKVLGSTPTITPLKVQREAATDGKIRRFTFESEAGITLTVRHEPPTLANAPTALLLDLEGADRVATSDLAGSLRKAGWGLLIPELRATGRYAWTRDKVGAAPDHNTAEWGMWLGRPLLGQWTVDVRRTLDALAAHDGKLPAKLTAVGVGPAGVVAICAAALDPRISQVATLGTLVSYITEVPYQGQRMGILAPGILRDVGDIQHLAALIAPRKLVIGGGVNGAGQTLNAASLRENFAFAQTAYEVTGAKEALALLAASQPEDIIQKLK